MVNDKSKGMLETEIDDDFDLDNIEDMPGFITPLSGVYTCVMEKGIEEKEIDGEKGTANYYDIPLIMKEVHETTEEPDDESPLPKEGDQFNLIFKRNNAFGMSNFKAFVRPIAEHLGTKKVGEIREQSKGLEIMVVLKRRWNKKSERYNIDIKKVGVL